MTELLGESLRKATRTVRWLTTVMVPASLAVFVLERIGALEIVARWFAPVTEQLGLPGSATIAIVSGTFINLYPVVAIIPALALTVRQVVIIALFSLVCHNLLVEVAVTRRNGTPALRMIVVRVGGAIALAWVMNALLPTGGAWGEPAALVGGAAADGTGAEVAASGGGAEDLPAAIIAWAIDLARLLVRVALIVGALTVATDALRRSGWLDRLSARAALPARGFGLPSGTAPGWIIAQTLGLAYGAAFLIDETASGRISREDGDLLNHHLAVSHSLVEDTMLFAVLGAPAWALIVPRVAFGFVTVWERRLERWIRRRRAPSRDDTAPSASGHT